MKKVKIGIIGYGRIAQLVHSNVLMNLANAELVAIAEFHPQRREQAHIDLPEVAVLSDYFELLARPDIEAVVICLPSALHAEAAIAALNQGKHIYLEKPLATNLKDGRNLVAAWQKSGVIGMVGFNFRFDSFYQEARQYLRIARLGKLIGARTSFSTRTKELPLWKQTRQSGGGALLELASHHFDLIHFLFEQEVKEVFADIQSLTSEDDSVCLQIRLDSGLPIQSFFSINSIDEDRLEIYGQKGKLNVDRFQSYKVEIIEPGYSYSKLQRVKKGLRSVASRPFLFTKSLSRHPLHSYRAGLSHFVQAIRNHEQPRPDLRDGYRSLRVIVAAEKSARNGKVVSLKEIDDENFVSL